MPIPPGYLSGICHLVGPGGGEFVRKPLPGGGAFVSSWLEAVNVVPFSIFHLKIYPFKNSENPHIRT